MKTFRIIHLLTTGRLLAPVMFLTILFTMLASCAPVPVPATVPVATALASSAPPTGMAETTEVETSPAQTEAPSSGSETQGPRLVVQLPDNSIVFVSLDGQQAPIAPKAPKGLYTAGFGRHAIQDGPIVYARSSWVQPAYYAIDTLAGKVSPLAFIQQDTHSLAVPMEGNGSAATSLAWGTFNGQGTPSTSLHVAASDGTEISLGADISDVTLQPGQEFALTPLRWGPDGSLYYSRIPTGIGGFIPYLGFTDLWRYDLKSGKSTQVVPSSNQGQVCLDELSADARLLATTCSANEIQVLDLSSNKTSTISLPEGLQDNLVGNVRFSPGDDRLAYGIFLGTPDDQNGAVAISDSLSGSSRVIIKSDAAGFYAPLAWLDEETILVHFFPQDENAPASLWVVKADGSEFTEIADGSFLGILP